MKTKDLLKQAVLPLAVMLSALPLLACENQDRTTAAKQVGEIAIKAFTAGTSRGAEGFTFFTPSLRDNHVTVKGTRPGQTCYARLAETEPGKGDWGPVHVGCDVL